MERRFYLKIQFDILEIIFIFWRGRPSPTALFAAPQQIRAYPYCGASPATPGDAGILCVLKYIECSFGVNSYSEPLNNLTEFTIFGVHKGIDAFMCNVLRKCAIQARLKFISQIDARSQYTENRIIAAIFLMRKCNICL